MKKKPWLWLLLGAIAFTFSSGRWNDPIMAWIWPLCMLSYSRQCRKASGLFVMLPAFVVCTLINSYGVVNSGIPIAEHLIIIPMCVLCLLPFFADRLLYGKLGRISKSLVFPTAFAVLELIKYSFTFTAYGSVAATKADNKMLMQTASLFGSYGVTFIVTWFGSAIHDLIRAVLHKQADGSRALFREAYKPAALFLTVFVAAMAFGGMRLALAPVDTPIIKAALVTGPYAGEMGEDANVPYPKSVRSLTDSVRTAAGGRADILIFSEEAFSMNKSDEAAFAAEAASLAKEHSMPMIIGLDIISEDDLQNKLLCIDAQGNSVWEYHKYNLVPVIEDKYRRGGGKIPIFELETASGIRASIASVVCFDSDMSHYVAHELPEHTDILAVPTWDWDAIRAYHTKWVEYRAAENGVNLLRSTYNGVSTAADAYGRVLMYSDTKRGGYECVVFAEVPAKGTLTLYNQTNGLICLIYPAGLLALAAAGLIGKRRKAQAGEKGAAA